VYIFLNKREKKRILFLKWSLFQFKSKAPCKHAHVGMNIETYVKRSNLLKTLQKELATGQAKLQFLLYAEENAKAQARQQLAAVTALQQQVDALTARQTECLAALGPDVTSTATASAMTPPAGATGSSPAPRRQ